jgi:hypothetical protein
MTLQEVVFRSAKHGRFADVLVALSRENNYGSGGSDQQQLIEGVDTLGIG